MKRLVFLLAAVLVLGATEPARAQMGQTLNLQEAIRIAQDGSPDAEVARLRFAGARWGHEVFEARYLPSVALTGSAPGLERSINEVTQPDGSIEFKPQSRLISRANVVVSQRLPWTGTDIFVASRLGRLDLMGSRELSQWNAAPFSIGISQPVFQFNSMKWERRVEPLSYEVDRRRLSEDRARVAEEVADRFFGAYIARMNEENAAFRVATNDTIYTLSKQRYKIGKIAENELLQSELQLLNAQNALSSARIESEQALQALKLELGLDYDTSFELVPPDGTPDLHVDPEAAVAQARQRRPAFANLRLQTLLAERDLERARKENGFSARIEASYGLNQQARQLRGAYRDPLNQQAFGVNFEVPILQWNAGDAQVEAARVEQQQAELEAEIQRRELDQEVYFEARQLGLLRRQVEIAAKADTVAARRFEVARNRYRIGKIDITDLFNAQREKDEAQRDFFQKLRQFWTSYYRLRRLTLYDFAEERPVLPGESR